MGLQALFRVELDNQEITIYMHGLELGLGLDQLDSDLDSGFDCLVSELDLDPGMGTRLQHCISQSGNPQASHFAGSLRAWNTAPQYMSG